MSLGDNSGVTGTENFGFFNEYERPLDPQRRIALPSQWRRRDGGNRFVLMPGRGRILQLTTYEFFRENFLERAKSVSLASAEQGLALARFGSRAQDCVCDKQGRVQISQKLLDYAGLKDSAMLVGAVDRIQIWDKARWEASQGDDESFFDELEKLSAKPDRLTDALRGAMGLGGDGK